MNSVQDEAADAAEKYIRFPLLRRGAPRRPRRKWPSWAALALLILTVDLMLAVAAWSAVDFFRH